VVDTWRCGGWFAWYLGKSTDGTDDPQNGQLYLHVLSEAAAVLKVRRAGSSDLLAAMSDLQAAVDAAETRAEELRAAENAARRRSHELQREWQDLLATRRQLDDAAEERERHGARRRLFLCWLTWRTYYHGALAENSVVMEQRTVEYEEQQRASEAQVVRDCYCCEIDTSFERRKLTVASLVQALLRKALEDVAFDQVRDRCVHAFWSTDDMECQRSTLPISLLVTSFGGPHTGRMEHHNLAALDKVDTLASS
jgi:hypothetical protein